MLQTPPVLSNGSSAPAGRTAGKAPPQQPGFQGDAFAALLGAKKPSEAGSAALRTRSGSTKSLNDGVSSSLDASDETSTDQPNPNQIIPAGAPQIPMIPYASLLGVEKGASASPDSGSQAPVRPLRASLARGEPGRGASAAAAATSSDSSADRDASSSFGFQISDGAAADSPALSSARSVKAPGPAAALSAKTHFAPEPAQRAALLTENTSEAPGLAAPPPDQSLSEQAPAAAVTHNDILAKSAIPALASEQEQTLKPKGAALPPTKARSALEQGLAPPDGSGAAELQTDAAVNGAPAARMTVSSYGRNGSSSGGSAKDTASQGNPGGGGQTSAPAEAPRPFEASAIGFAAGGASPTPAQQITSEIQRAIPAPTDSQALTGAAPPALDGQPLKTITVALSPASLGAVAVELSLKGGQLGVKLQVQEAGTAQLLRQDGALQKLLESAGYAVQSLSIHLSPQLSQPEPAQGQTAANAQNFANQFASGGGGQDQANSQGYRGRPADPNAHQRPGYGRTEDLGGGGSLYV